MAKVATGVLPACHDIRAKPLDRWMSVAAGQKTLVIIVAHRGDLVVEDVIQVQEDLVLLAKDLLVVMALQEVVGGLVVEAVEPLRLVKTLQHLMAVMAVMVFHLLLLEVL